jgi:hypothetical protein
MADLLKRLAKQKPDLKYTERILKLQLFYNFLGDDTAHSHVVILSTGLNQTNCRCNQKEEKGMSNSQPWKNLKFEAPASYRIRVQGHLDDSWSDRLSGMVITRAFTADREPMTILIGHLRDQSALCGALNALYDLHLPVISVELLDEMQA